MDCIKSKTLMVGLLCYFLQNQALYGHQPTSVEIIPLKATIQIGEPLFIKVIYKFEKPCRDVETGDIYHHIHCNAFPLVEVKGCDKDWLSNYPDAVLIKPEEGGTEYYPLPQMYPSSISILDDDGLVYGDFYAIFNNPYKKGAIFDHLGTYRLCIITDNKIFSNIIELKVNSGMAKKECVLSDTNGYMFLMGIEKKIFKDPKYRSKIISDLKILAEQCSDSNSILAKWAAARVGLEYYMDDELEKVKARREKKEVRKDIFEQAIKYLSIAAELPDDFAIRQEVLYRLAEIEGEKHNYSKALFYIDELRTKYPKTKYGRYADGHKNEVLKLQKQGPKDAK